MASNHHRLFIPVQHAAIPVAQQEEGEEGAQHGNAGDEQMVDGVALGVEQLPPGHGHAHRVHQERRTIGRGANSAKEGVRVAC
jgi:hypothetical protein